MGAGFHGGFGATKGYCEGNPAAGEIVFAGLSTKVCKFISQAIAIVKGPFDKYARLEVPEQEYDYGMIEMIYMCKVSRIC